MNEQIRQIASRIKELREILEISEEEIAREINIPLSEYKTYENATADIPIGVLYSVAAHMGIDPTVLLTGESPRMDEYTVVRQGKGVSIERYAGYAFSSLAFNYKNRDMEPMIVTISPKDKAELVCHEGQEFNYILEGTIELSVGGKKILLKAGDSIYFNPSIPHGQRAVGGNAKFLTVINE